MPNDIRPEVRVQMNALGRAIGETLPSGFGFALLVFNLSTEEGFMNYISNADRSDMVVALKEFIAKMEAE